MKQGAPPQRKAPLKRGLPPKRTALHTKVGPKPQPRELPVALRLLSPRPVDDRVPVEFRPAVKRIVLRRSRGWCEMPGCTRHALEYHHRKMRSAGGRGQVWNCLHLCIECHDWVHDNARVAYRHGALIRRSRPDDPGVHFHPGWRTCPLDHAPGVDLAPPDAVTLRAI